LISETLLFIIFFGLWIVTFVLSLVRRDTVICGVGGVVGVLLGIRLMSIEGLFGLIVLIVALIQLYWAAFTEPTKNM
jgi:hypothetical protein